MVVLVPILMLWIMHVLTKLCLRVLSKSATISKMAFSTYIFEVLYISVIGRPYDLNYVNLATEMTKEG